MGHRSFRRRIAVVAAIGVAARMVATLAWNRHSPIGIGDGFFYHQAANNLADGVGFVDPLLLLTGDDRPTSLHPPLWPALLSLVSAVGLDTELAHRLVGVVVGTALIPVVAVLGRTVGGPRVGLVAAVVVALHPTMLAADGSLHAETLFAVLATGAVLAAASAAGDDRVRLAAVAGALCGFAALARGEGIVLGALLAAALAWRRPAGTRLVPAVGLVTAMALVIAPWTARNVMQLDDLVLISTNDSTVIAGANCDPTYFGSDIGTWHLECIPALEPTRDEAGRAREWRALGVEYARDHVERLPLVATARVLRVWGVMRPFQEERIEGRSTGLQHVGIVLHLGALLPLALVGAVLALRRRAAVAWFVMTLPVLVTVTGLLAFGMVRFRHGAEAAIAVFAAVAVVAAADRRPVRSA